MSKRTPYFPVHQLGRKGWHPLSSRAGEDHVWGQKIMSMTAHSGLRNHGIIQGEIKQAAQKGAWTLRYGQHWWYTLGTLPSSVAMSVKELFGEDGERRLMSRELKKRKLRLEPWGASACWAGRGDWVSWTVREMEGRVILEAKEGERF